MKNIIPTFCCLLMIAAWNNAFADCINGKSLYKQSISETDITQKIRLLEASVKECPDFNASYELAKAYEADSQLKKAEKNLLEAGNIAKGNKAIAKVLIRMGLIYEKTGRKEDAYNLIWDAYKLHPYPRVLERLKKMDIQRMETGISPETIVKSLTRKGLVRGYRPEPSLDIYIHFPFDSYEFSPKGRKQADRLGRALADPVFANTGFVLIGHTDYRGTHAHNNVLSGKRAKTVMDYIIKNYSLDPNRLSFKGRGKYELLYHGKTEQDHELNRRVEVKMAE